MVLLVPTFNYFASPYDDGWKKKWKRNSPHTFNTEQLTDMKASQQRSWWCCSSFNFTWAAAKRTQKQTLLSVIRNVNDQFPSTHHAPGLNTPNTLLTRHESTQCDKDKCYRHKDNCQQAMKYASVSTTTPTKLHIITRQTSQRVLLSNSNHEPRRCAAKCPSDIAQGRRNLTQSHFFRIYRIQYYTSRFPRVFFSNRIYPMKILDVLIVSTLWLTRQIRRNYPISTAKSRQNPKSNTSQITIFITLLR